MTAPLKVLIVDDSAFMRTVIRQIVSTEPGFAVAGEAADGAEALAAIRRLSPDIVTLDVEMPVLDGIGVLKQALPRAGERPVFVMVSAFTTAGAALTLAALEAGALDFVPKASENFNVDLAQVGVRLREKLGAAAAALRSMPAPPRPSAASSIPGTGRQAATVGTATAIAATPLRAAQPMTPRPAMQAAPAADAQRIGLSAAAARAGAPDLVAVVASTGGPQTLPKLLKPLAGYPAPIVIAQHIPPLFSKSLADSLAQALGIPCVEAENGMPLRPGTVYLLPGGADGEIARNEQGALVARIRPPGETAYHPCGNTLFRSAALSARRPVGVILTGMGSDGTDGAATLSKRGRPVLVQDPSTAVLWGMPRSAVDAGIATDVLPVEKLAARLLALATGGGGA